MKTIKHTVDGKVVRTFIIGTRRTLKQIFTVFTRQKRDGRLFKALAR